MSEISIITKTKVDKTFSGEECLLKRTITMFMKKDGIRKYTILTERCNYKEQPIEEDLKVVIDPVTGEATETTTENPTMETVLVILDTKDTDYDRVVSPEEADLLFIAIKDIVTLGDSYNDFVITIERLSLLLGTQQQAPYGTVASDWEILT